jgi:glyoxylase-like metal-dependent hydrolase (beta-lactamase superfamily II)
LRCSYRSRKKGDPIAGRQLFSAGDRLPVGIEVFPGREPNDLVLWVESRRALVAGDTLIDRGPGLEFPVTWVPEGVPPEQILQALRPLLERPVELVLDPRRADRPSRPRARALLTVQPGSVARCGTIRDCGYESDRSSSGLS